jgi:uncharacterized protein (TIGR02271 family)
MRRRKVAATDKKHLARIPARTTQTVVPVIEEDVKVGKRVVESGRVQIIKRVEERQQLIDEPLLKDEVEVKRVPINRPVDRVVPPREVGDVLIIPVMEEVLVVEKRLILKEELHVRRTTRQTRQPQRITLRGERAEIKRIDPPTQP